MDTFLKVECDGDVRRAVLKDATTYSSIDSAIQELWPGQSAKGTKYLDEEGDACTLNEHTFSDFLTTIKETARGHVLRLQIVPSGSVSQSVEIVEEEKASEASESMSAGKTESAVDEFPIGTPPQSPRSYELEMACDASVPKMVTNEVSGSAAAELIIDHNSEEQIDLIMAAFDEGMDEHLNFSELSALHMAAWGAKLLPEAYGSMCADEGEDPDVGLGKEALMCVYNRCRSLEMDFEAAKKKLEGTAAGTLLEPSQHRDSPEVQSRKPSSTDESLLNGVAYSMDTPPGSPRAVSIDAHGQDLEVAYAMSENGGTEQEPAQQPSDSFERSNEELFIDHDKEEKIDLVMAAFDEDGDEHLNFSECNELHRVAWGADLSRDLYEAMCADEGEDPEAGLDKEALMCIYSRCRSLETDFNAAKRKLEGADAEDRRPQEQSGRDGNPLRNLVCHSVTGALGAASSLLRVR